MSLHLCLDDVLEGRDTKRSKRPRSALPNGSRAASAASNPSSPRAHDAAPGAAAAHSRRPPRRPRAPLVILDAPSDDEANGLGSDDEDLPTLSTLLSTRRNKSSSAAAAVTAASNHDLPRLVGPRPSSDLRGIPLDDHAFGAAGTAASMPFAVPSDSDDDNTRANAAVSVANFEDCTHDGVNNGSDIDDMFDPPSPAQCHMLIDSPQAGEEGGDEGESAADIAAADTNHDGVGLPEKQRVTDRHRLACALSKALLPGNHLRRPTREASQALSGLLAHLPWRNMAAPHPAFAEPRSVVGLVTTFQQIGYETTPKSLSRDLPAFPF